MRVLLQLLAVLLPANLLAAPGPHAGSHPCLSAAAARAVAGFRRQREAGTPP